jgi:exodeoxyribonuclease V gamma subunit
VAAALLRVVELARGRVSAPDVMDFISLEPVCRRFAIDSHELPQIETWLRESGIRWGVDAAHRASHHKQPAERANTFEQGLDRLLIGVAMAAEEHRLLDDVLPLDVEGEVTLLVGRFAELARTLFRQLQELQRERTLAAWIGQLNVTLDSLTATTKNGAWLSQQVRDQLNDILQEGGLASTRKITLDGIHSVLSRRLDVQNGSVRQHAGAITFCSLGPVRSIPYRVVCLLGMDDAVFPRKNPELSFDLTADDRWPGDPSPRDADRLMFLEALLAARDHLVITYAGRCQRTNQELPAAVPVEELLDIVDESFSTPKGHVSARDLVVVEHPLQPFSRKCFGVASNGRAVAPTSYDRRLLAGVKAQGDEEAPRFFPSPLSAGGHEEGPNRIELADLIQFFLNPARFLLNRRLGIWASVSPWNSTGWKSGLLAPTSLQHG